MDFKDALAELLEEMRSRSNDSAYLFPAPRMFGEDAPARSLKGALYKARELAGVDGFGYHDWRYDRKLWMGGGSRVIVGVDNSNK